MNFLKKVYGKVKDNVFRLYAGYCGMMGAFLASYCNVLAADAQTGKIDGFIDFACEWLTKIGGTVALVGGTMFALSWQRDDAEGKSKALMTIMAGLMLIAVAAGKDMFFA